MLKGAIKNGASPKEIAVLIAENILFNSNWYTGRKLLNAVPNSCARKCIQNSSTDHILCAKNCSPKNVKSAN
ncbi:hypothetical protein CBP51_15090 [Cellvibrio mixtus]|uniref:Uncharacterized protein n=1 Tax=Cellvibrio mixtus TaxID=39650 RepID=A0A266Q3R9_9GAMM|nr:hypothetical protein CBP51_15090 [Cellvibrio mixtus]